MSYVVNSELYKLSLVKPVTFINTWTVPTTRQSTHAKMGAQFVWQPNTLMISPKTSNVDFPSFSSKTVGGVKYYGSVSFSLAKIGLRWGNTGSWPCDNLTIGEANTENDKKNIMYRVYTLNIGGNDYRYTKSNDCWDLCPKSFACSTTIGGTAAYLTIPAHLKSAASADPSCWALEFVEHEIPDCGGTTFGNQTLTWKYKVTGIVNDSIYAPQTGTREGNFNVMYVTDCEAVNVADETTTPNYKYWDYLSGGGVTTNQYYGVLDNEWNICHADPHSTVNNWQIDFSTCSWSEDSATDGSIKYVSANNIVLPTMKCYIKKHAQYKASENIFYEFTNIEQTPIYYYNGIPLFTSNEKGKVKVVLNFVRDATTYGVKYVISDSPFGNTDTLTGNVQMFDDSGVGVTSRTIGTGGSITTSQTFYIETQRDKTYWIKACPDTAGKKVTITSAASFDAEKEN